MCANIKDLILFSWH